MDPENQTPVEESPAARWERIQKSREGAMEKCWTACTTGDLNQFNNQIQESFKQLGDANVKTLLQRTIIKNWVEGTRCLLEQGADPKIIPLTILAKKCRSIAMLQLLVEFGIDYKSGDQNILEYVLDRREILDWLLDQGLDINSGSNRTLKGVDKLYRDNSVEVLNKAAYYGDINLFDHLIARGAKPSQSNALHNASRSKNAVAMITHLIDIYHLDVNASDDCGGLNELVQWNVTPGSPLNYAITYSNLPAAEVLLKYGAKIGDACGIAIKNKNTPAVKLILDRGADPSEGLGNAITNDYFEGSKLCLEHGGDIAIGEARDKMVAGLGSTYTGMSNKIRTLLDEWRDKQQKT